MKMKYAGDIVVNGAFDGKTIIAFGSYHYGAHNGIGGEQHDAFFVSKEKYDFSKEINARVLHDLFKQY